MRFPTSNTLKTLETWSLNSCHLLWRRRKCTLVPALCWLITLLSHGNATLRVAWRWNYKTIPNTRLQRVKSKTLCSVASKRKAWRHTMATCWTRQTPLCDSQDLQLGMASKTWWLACQVIKLFGSGNYTLSRIWDGITITNPISTTEVETSLKYQMVDAAASLRRASHLHPSPLLQQRYTTETSLYRNAHCQLVLGNKNKQRYSRIMTY